MPDESNTATPPESTRCDALDTADFESMLNEAACGLEEPPTKVSETQSATEQSDENGLPAGETVASPAVPVDDVVADERADPPTQDDALAEESQPAEPSQSDAATAAEVAAEAVEPVPDRDSHSVREVPWDEQPFSGKDAGAPAPLTDTAVPEAPDKAREPEDRWALATTNAGEAADTSEMPSSGPEHRWNVVVWLLGRVLEVLDRPFARLAPWTKDLIGYAAIATFVMAIAVWALVILRT